MKNWICIMLVISLLSTCFAVCACAEESSTALHDWNLEETDSFIENASVREKYRKGTLYENDWALVYIPDSVSETPPTPVVMQLAALPRDVITAKAASALLPPVERRTRFSRKTMITEEAILNPAGIPPRNSSAIFFTVICRREKRKTQRFDRK